MGGAWRSWSAGGPGLVLGLIAALTLREPRRREKIMQEPITPSLGFRREIALIMAQRSFLLLACGAAINNFLGYGRAAFYAPYFLRTQSVELGEIAKTLGMGLMTSLGLAIGLTTGIAGIAGSFVGGKLGDRLGSRDARWYGTVPAIAAVLNVPTFIVVMMLPLPSALVMLFVASFLNTIWYGSVYNATQSVTPQGSRATAAALLLSFITLFGLALGPLTVGAISDFATYAGNLGSGEGLRVALIAVAPLGLIGALFLFLAGRMIERELVE